MNEKSNEASSWMVLFLVGILMIILSILFIYVSNLSNLAIISYAMIFMAFGLMCIIPGITYLIKKYKNNTTDKLSYKETDLLSDLGLGIVVIFAGMASIAAFLARSDSFFVFLLICLIFGIPLIYRYTVKKRKVILIK